MSRGIVISLCDITGTLVKPWLDGGYSAILVDPQHPVGVHEAGGLVRVGHRIDDDEAWAVLRDAVQSRSVAFVAGFPPCTDLAVSGARWFKQKASEDPAFQFRAMQVVWQCHVIAEMSGAPYFLENPVSRISSFWRKPDHTFHPYHYTGYAPEDNYTKKTCLWTGGGFIMPRLNMDARLGPPDNRIHACPPSEERANIRSATPRGFAEAVFHANAPRTGR